MHRQRRTTTQGQLATVQMKGNKNKQFIRAFSGYIDTLTALRTFAYELDPAVQSSARKAQFLIDQASNNTEQFLDLFPIQEFIGHHNPDAATEHLKSMSKENLEVLRSAAAAGLHLLTLAQKYHPHEQIMRGGVLMSLIGAFEVLLGDILRLFYECYPAALESAEDKMFSLREICSFKSLEAFLEHVIENKINAFLRGSLVDWVKFFQQKKIEMMKFAPSWESFAECFQRRHVIVHNGGRVSSQYLQHVGRNWIEAHPDEAQLGRSLLLSKEYVTQAFDSFELCGIPAFSRMLEAFRPR
jgi:hypothetical protein